MIITAASLGRISTSVDPTASALRASFRPAVFVPAHREPDEETRRLAQAGRRVQTGELREAA